MNSKPNRFQFGFLEQQDSTLANYSLENLTLKLSMPLMDWKGISNKIRRDLDMKFLGSPPSLGISIPPLIKVFQLGLEWG